MQQFYLALFCLLTSTEYLCASTNIHLIPTIQLISGTLKNLEFQEYYPIKAEEFHRFLLFTSQQLEHAQQAINNEKEQLEQEICMLRETTDHLRFQFAEIVRNEAKINNKLTDDIQFYKQETISARKKEYEAAMRAKEIEGQLQCMAVMRAKDIEEQHDRSYGFPGIFKKYAMTDQGKKTSSMSIFRSRSTAKAKSPIEATSTTKTKSAVPQDITETNNACQSSIESETMFADASAST